MGDELLMHGRGMVLIEALAARWGVVPLASGKCVWVEVGHATVPEDVLLTMDRVRPVFYEQKESISKQAARARRAGAVTVNL